MDIQKAKQAVSVLAQREGVSEQEILAEIEKAIAAGVETAKQQGNEEMLRRWKEITPGHMPPDAYTLIACITERLQNDSRSR